MKNLFTELLSLIPGKDINFRKIDQQGPIRELPNSHSCSFEGKYQIFYTNSGAEKIKDANFSFLNSLYKKYLPTSINQDDTTLCHAINEELKLTIKAYAGVTVIQTFIDDLIEKQVYKDADSFWRDLDKAVEVTPTRPSPLIHCLLGGYLEEEEKSEEKGLLSMLDMFSMSAKSQPVKKLEGCHSVSSAINAGAVILSPKFDTEYSKAKYFFTDHFEIQGLQPKVNSMTLTAPSVDFIMLASLLLGLFDNALFSVSIDDSSYLSLSFDDSSYEVIYKSDTQKVDLEVRDALALQKPSKDLDSIIYNSANSTVRVYDGDEFVRCSLECTVSIDYYVLTYQMYAFVTKDDLRKHGFTLDAYSTQVLTAYISKFQKRCFTRRDTIPIVEENEFDLMVGNRPMKAIEYKKNTQQEKSKDKLLKKRNRR
ncbi:hypothetical protein AB837_00070 [bacterium AB1]|nr:hypothetical protein AB837_00070 [bacterium AB1]